MHVKAHQRSSNAIQSPASAHGHHWFRCTRAHGETQMSRNSKLLRNSYLPAFHRIVSIFFQFVGRVFRRVFERQWSHKAKMLSKPRSFVSCMLGQHISPSLLPATSSAENYSKENLDCPQQMDMFIMFSFSCRPSGLDVCLIGRVDGSGLNR